MDFKVTISSHEVTDMLHDLTDRAEHLPWDSVGRLEEQSIKENFDAGGRPNKWAAKKDGEPSYLKESGALEESVTYCITTNGVEVGPTLEYAKFLDNGTKFMPPRTITTIQPKDEKEIVDLLADHLTDKL